MDDNFNYEQFADRLIGELKARLTRWWRNWRTSRRRMNGCGNILPYCKKTLLQ